MLYFILIALLAAQGNSVVHVRHRATTVVNPVQMMNPACHPGSGATTVNCTWGSAPTNGNIVALTWECGGSTNITSITETNVTWAGTAAVTAGISRLAQIWLGTVGASASTTVTVNFPALGSANCWLTFSEWTGFTTTQDVAAVVNNATTTTNAACTGVTTVTNNDLILAQVSTTTTGAITSGPTNSYTAITSSGNSVSLPAYLLQGTAGATSTAWTIPSASYDCATIALKHQ